MTENPRVNQTSTQTCPRNVRRLAEVVASPVYFGTHRDRMTTDCTSRWVCWSVFPISRSPSGRVADGGPRAGSQCGISNYYATLDALLARGDVDLAIVGAPTNRDITVRAAQAGRHVVVETPMRLDLAEANRMTEACAHRRQHLHEIGKYRPAESCSPQRESALRFRSLKTSRPLP